MIASMIWVVRIVVHELGQPAWAALAMMAAAFDLSIVLDGATSELATYEGARARTRAELVSSLDQILMLSIAPALLGTLALIAAAFIASRGDEKVLGTLLLLTAAGYPIFVLGNVYSGTLQGLGWIRDYNLVNVTVAAAEFAVLIVGAGAHWSLPTIQVVRGLRLVLRVVLLVTLVRMHGLPVAKLAKPDWHRLASLVRYAIGYGVTRLFAQVIYRGPIFVAPLIGLPLAHCATLVVVDQVAAVAYRFAHVAYESLLPRLTLAFRGTHANDGSRLYVAASFGLAALLVPFGVGVTLGGPWLFEVWLDRDLVHLDALLPIVVATWVVNGCASLSACVLMARGLSQMSAQIHAVVVTIHALLGLVLVPALGVIGVALAMAGTNLALLIGLSLAATWATSVARVRYYRVLLPMLGVGALIIAAARSVESSSLLLAIAGGSVALLSSLGLLATSREAREVLRGSSA